MAPPDAEGARRGKCPICGSPTEHRYRPFCSRRCADIDLGRWFNGSYAVPVVEPDEDDPDEFDETADEAGDEDGPGR